MKELKTNNLRNIIKGCFRGVAVVDGLIIAILLVICFQPQIQASSSHYQAYVVYKQQPIAIQLPLNQTKSLRFEHVVKLGMSPSLSQHVKVKYGAGIMTITAIKAFVGQRAEVKDMVTGEVMLLNLSASQTGGSSVPLAILTHAPNLDQASHDTQRGWLKTPKALQGEMGYLTLTRFAQQQLYGKKRLIKNPYNIRLINSYVNSRGVIPQQLGFNNLFLDQSTINLPWATWSGGGYYVSAILVRNQLPTQINLKNNLTNICGRQSGLWKSVTFFPSWKLARAGNKNDTTMAFLISKKPLDEAIKQCSGE